MKKSFLKNDIFFITYLMRTSCRFGAAADSTSILQEATQCNSLALDWICFRFIYSRCFFFILPLFSVVGVTLWAFSTTSDISQ